jgi:hypothetical protein
MTDQLPATMSQVRHAVPALVAAGGDEHNSNPKPFPSITTPMSSSQKSFATTPFWTL